MAAHVLDLPLDDVIKQKAGGGGGGGKPAAARAPVVAARSLGTGNAKATRCVNPKGLSLALKAAAAAAKATSATASASTKARETKVEGAAKAGGRARAATGKAGGPVAGPPAGKLVNPGEKLAMTLDDVIKRQSKADAAGNRRQRGGIRRQGGKLRTTPMTQGRSAEGKVRGRARAKAKAKAKARMGPMMSRMRAKRGRPEPAFAWGNSSNRFASAAGPARGVRASSGRASGFDFGRRMATRAAPARPLWGWAAIAAPPPKRARTWQEGPSDWEPPFSRRSSRGTRVRVGNIPRNLDCYDIREAFEDVGRVSGCDVSNGVAYVWFDREIDAKKAVQTFDHGELNGQMITVRMV